MTFLKEKQQRDQTISWFNIFWDQKAPLRPPRLTLFVTPTTKPQSSILTLCPSVSDPVRFCHPFPQHKVFVGWFWVCLWVGGFVFLFCFFSLFIYLFIFDTSFSLSDSSWQQLNSNLLRRTISQLSGRPYHIIGLIQFPHNKTH